MCKSVYTYCMGAAGRVQSHFVVATVMYRLDYTSLAIFCIFAPKSTGFKNKVHEISCPYRNDKQ